MGGSVIDGLAGLPSTWIATESLAAGFNRPTKPGDLSQLVQVLGGASQCDPIYNFAEGEPCRERAPNGKGIRSTLVSGFAAHDGIQTTAEPLDQFIKRKGGRLNAWDFLFDDASLQNT